MKKANDLTGLEDWISSLTKEEARAFVRLATGAPRQILEGKERDQTLLMLTMIEPYSTSNNQHSWTDYYMIGKTEYHVTIFPGEEAIVEKMLDNEE